MFCADMTCFCFGVSPQPRLNQVFLFLVGANSFPFFAALITEPAIEPTSATESGVGHLLRLTCWIWVTNSLRLICGFSFKIQQPSLNNLVFLCPTAYGSIPANNFVYSLPSGMNRVSSPSFQSSNSVSCFNKTAPSWGRKVSCTLIQGEGVI